MAVWQPVEIRDGMIETVKTLLFEGGSGAQVHECRHCGTTVESPSAECPSCGRTEIASFQTR